MEKELPMKKIMINFEVESSYDYDGYKLDSSDFKDIEKRIKEGVKELMWEIMGSGIFYENESGNCGENEFVINFSELQHYK